MINADKLAELSSYIIKAHDAFSIEEKRRTRYWDKKTPQGIHPLWCATTILGETELPELLRENGAQALLFHDLIEDTTVGLPENCPEAVKKLVEELTEPDYELAWEKIKTSSNEAKLLRLYDMTSNMLDASWLAPEKRNSRIEKVQNLANLIKENYGNLNIVAIANAICEKWKKNDKKNYIQVSERA